MCHFPVVGHLVLYWILIQIFLSELYINFSTVVCFCKKKVDPSLQVDVRPVFKLRLKEELRARKLQDDMRRRYVEDKWRYFTLLIIKNTDS